MPYYRSFNNLFITSSYVYKFIICFIFVLFILNIVLSWTNTVGAEVAKTAKSNLNRLFVYFFYFVVPSATVGKYKEQSLTAMTNLTEPTLITDTH